MTSLANLVPSSPRERFILYSTLGYFVLAMTWIFLSDRLLSGIADVRSMLWLQTAKSVFFVLATAALFQLALRVVPSLPDSGREPVLTLLAHGDVERPGAAVYLAALLLPLGMLLLRQAVTSPERPLLILLVFPIILSALMGGLLPGLLATAMAVSGDVATGMAQLYGHRTMDNRDFLALAVLALNGVTVSFLSELRRRSQAKAHANQELLDAVVAGTSDAVFVKDVQGRYLLINEAGARMLDKVPRDIVGRDDTACFPPSDAQALMVGDQAIMQRGKTQTYEELLSLPDVGQRTFLVTKGPVFGHQGEVKGVFGISRDITERKEAERAQRRAAIVFENSQEGILISDTQMRIVSVNPAFTRITGYDAKEVLGRTPHILSSGRHDAEFFRHMWATIEEHGCWRGEIWNRRKNGEVYAELLSISAVRDAAGAAQHYVGTFADISKYKAHEDELNRIAHYDPLTGLPNRHLLADRLTQALRSHTRSKRMVAVCFLDLDRFKTINDKHGHAAGDALLVSVARHLRQELRGEDTLARLGGDEFVVLLTDLESLEACDQALDRILQAVAKPVQLEQGRICVTASIGVTLAPLDDADADTLLRHADHAMYVAKETGRNRYHLFDPDSDRRAQQHRQMLEVLHTALLRREFVLHYQPKVDLLTGRVVGAEALIRWHHPERGVLPPGAFLDHITGSNLEQPLGRWVIDEAMDQAERWHLQGLDLRVSVNVSAHHLLHPDFCEDLRAAFKRHPQLSPGNFELEVLETAALDDMEQAFALVSQCKQLGVHFSLDDFGTGYSSLSYLRRLPVDELKIDQSFVRDMLNDDDDRGIVQAVIKLAGVFHRQVIAEGVETMAHGAALLAMGCRQAQGYGIAKPMPATDFQAWSVRWQAEAPWQVIAGAA